MIFVTVGTEKFPFDRLLKAIEEAIGNKSIEEEVFAQIGYSDFRPKLFPYEKFISFDDMRKYIKESSVIVAHAGEGTTLLCLSLGRVPIVMPRSAAFKEHVDDHQVEFARRMGELEKALVAYSDKELVYKIKNYANLVAQLKPSLSGSSKNGLINYLKNICIPKH